MAHPSVEKLGFFFSIAFLFFVYGFLAHANQWPPSSLLKQVQKEASNMWYRPSLTTRVYDRQGVQIEDSSAIQPGLTFINSLWKYDDGWHPGFKLISRDGRTVHDWRVNRATLFPDSIDRRGDPTQKLLHGSHLLPNGDVVFNIDYVGTARIGPCGQVRWRLSKGNHHSVARAEDGSFWISGTSKDPRRTTDQYPNGFPGLNQPVWLDQIHHVSAGGKLLERINVLDLLYSNDFERYIVKAYEPQANEEAPQTKDLTHMNDVEPLPASMADEYPLFDAGDLLVSLRKLGILFVVEPDSKTIKWHVRRPVIQQHDPDFIGNGWIGIFDNNRDYIGRGKMLGGSRIVAVQPHTDSVEIRFPTDMSDPFYTATMGKWQQLKNGNMLLTESKAGRVVEVTPEGRTVWEWIIEPYNNSKVSRISQAVRHDLTQKDVASWSCSEKE